MDGPYDTLPPKDMTRLLIQTSGVSTEGWTNPREKYDTVTTQKSCKSSSCRGMNKKKMNTTGIHIPVDGILVSVKKSHDEGDQS